MKSLSRVGIAGFVCALALFILLVPVNWSGIWSDIRWGTAPEWVGALALVSIAATLWMMARSSGLPDSAQRGRGVDFERREP